MSEDFPIPRQDTRSDGPTIVEWGDDGPSRRGRRSSWLAGIGQNPRLVPVAAGLAAVAVFASLVGEWTITTVPNSEPSGVASVRVPAGVAEVGNFGVAYLVGVLGLVNCLALVIFGAPPAVRHTARMIGLATAGTLLALLAAAAYSLNHTAERRLFYPPDAGFRIEYGPGLVLAFVGTAGLGLALHLAGRFIGPPARLDDSTPTATADHRPTGPDDRLPIQDDLNRRADGGGWRWRVRRPAPAPDSDRRAPTDLTVTPAIPFARPEHRDGRSGEPRGGR
jgi:uncharacterized membrane protein YqjE